MARGRKKSLTEEDRALWTRVAATATPIDRGSSPRMSDQDAPAYRDPVFPDPAVSQRPELAAQIPPFRVGEQASDTAAFTPPQGTRPTKPPLRMDHATHRRMIRGRLKPEGRLDLHGMTLDEAHPALIGFIFRAHAAQKRLVLVITGKGKDRDSCGPIPIRRGILRHQVPAWLTSPPLSTIVLDLREAHARHGGGGAFYVYLRRPR